MLPAPLAAGRRRRGAAPRRRRARPSASGTATRRSSPTDPAHETSIKTRLGWLRVARAHAERSSPSSRPSSPTSRGAGFTDAVLLGMGGSSLAPEVLARPSPAQTQTGCGCTSSTTPIRRPSPASTRRSPARRRSSSSPRSRAARSRSSRSSGTSGRRRSRRTRATSRARAPRFVAITDPATRLGQLAEEKKYRNVFVNAADIGGRYSALSYFGLVPAALLAGADVAGLAREAAVELAAASSAVVPAPDPAALRLGVGARRRRKAAATS